MPTSKASSVVEIPRPNIKVLSVEIEGTTPLIFHKFAEKTMRQMEEKQQKKAGATKKEARNPEEEYEASFYRNKDGKVAFPANNLKQSFVNACRVLNGVPMTLIRAAVFVVGDEEGLIEVIHKGEEMRKDMVRIGMGTSDIRYRGQVKDWRMKFLVKFNADVLSEAQVLHLIQTAGFSVGIGEWRPEKNGDFGTYTLPILESKTE